MSNYDREQLEMDAVQRDIARGEDLVVIGWVLLLFNAIPFMFIWSGWRAGSMFWTYWAVIEGAIGTVLVMAGWWYKSKAGSEIPRLPIDEVGTEGGRKAA